MENRQDTGPAEPLASFHEVHIGPDDPADIRRSFAHRRAATPEEIARLLEVCAPHRRLLLQAITARLGH